MPRVVISSLIAVLVMVAWLNVTCQAQTTSINSFKYATGSGGVVAELLKLADDVKSIETDTKTEDPDFEDAFDVYTNGRNSIVSPGTFRALRNLTTVDFSTGTSVYDTFLSYFGNAGAADEFVSNAILGLGEFANPTINTAKDARKEASMKGIQSMHIPSLMLQHLELAVSDCSGGNTQSALRNWDYAFAYYVGKGEVDEGKGKMFFQLANKRCKEACTCETDKAISPINVAIVQNFISGQAKLNSTDCSGANLVVSSIRKRIVSVLLQGVTRALFANDPVNFGFENKKENKTEDIPKKRTEGFAYLMGVLPYIASCNAVTATRLQTAMTVTSSSFMSEGWQPLVAALQETFSCLEVDCAEVGGFCKEVDGDDTDDIVVWVPSACPSAAPSPAPSSSPSLRPSSAPSVPLLQGSGQYSVGDIVGASIGAIAGVSLVAAAAFVVYSKHTKAKFSEMLAIELKDGASTHYRD